MRSIKHPLIIIAALLIGGCNLDQADVYTIHPFYTDQTMIFDRTLLGTWDVEGGDFEMNFLSHEDESYLLTWNIGQDTIAFDAHLVQIGERTFLDLYPNMDALNEALCQDSAGLGLTQLVYVSRMMPLHWIYRLEYADSCLSMEVICGDGLLVLFNKKEVRTKYLEAEGAVILTAGTRRLQKIVSRKQVDDLFTVAGGFILRRPDVPMDSSHVHIAEAVIP